MAAQSHREIVPSGVVPVLPRITTLGDASVPVRRQVLSDSQWEDLKPIIRRLYIDENKTYSKVARILRDSHGFAPT